MTPFSSAFIVDFEQVNVSGVIITCFYSLFLLFVITKVHPICLLDIDIDIVNIETRVKNFDPEKKREPNLRLNKTASLLYW